MESDNSRRHFFMLAGSALLSSTLTTKLSASSWNSSQTDPVDELLVKSELSAQIDRLLDTVIKKNPQHTQLTDEQIAALKAEGAEQLGQAFKNLAQKEFSAEDLDEMVRHLSQPAERKWQHFNRLAIDEAKTLLSHKIEDAIQKRKSV